MKTKKLASLLLAALLATTALTGCGVSSDDPNASKSTTIGYPDEDGYAVGGLGDTMHTEFFDYTVNSAYTCDTYENYAPNEGYQLLVAEITVKNTYSESIEMYDTDFQMQWDDDSDDAYSWPITFYLDSGTTIGKDMLPDVYQLAKNERRTGILVFEVPVGSSDFSISYLTYYADDTTGDIFFVFFDAPRK